MEGRAAVLEQYEFVMGSAEVDEEPLFAQGQDMTER